MESGEYFITEEERKRKKMQERKIVIEQKAEEKKRKREAEYEEPSKPFKKHKPKDKVNVFFQSSY